MKTKVVSLRLAPLDITTLKELQTLLFSEGLDDGEDKIPTQAATVRAALWHYRRVATPEQRRHAWLVTRGVRGPMDLGEDPARWDSERTKEERTHEDAREPET